MGVLKDIYDIIKNEPEVRKVLGKEINNILKETKS